LLCTEAAPHNGLGFPNTATIASIESRSSLLGDDGDSPAELSAYSPHAKYHRPAEQQKLNSPPTHYQQSYQPAQEFQAPQQYQQYPAYQQYPPQPPAASPAAPLAGAGAGGPYAEAGLPPLPGQRRRKMYIPSSKWTWAFTGVTIAQALLGLGLEASVSGLF
jgi:hypothetical protein